MNPTGSQKGKMRNISYGILVTVGGFFIVRKGQKLRITIIPHLLKNIFCLRLVAFLQYFKKKKIRKNADLYGFLKIISSLQPREHQDR